MPSDKFRQQHPKNKRTKFQLVFDEDSRKDFLTGFQKRKKARKKIAEQEAEEKRKEERRIERKQRREAMEEELKSIRLPDIKDKPTDKDVVVYDHPKHTVTVTSITSIDLEEEHGGIGRNKAEYDDTEDDANGKVDGSNGDVGDGDGDSNDDSENVEPEATLDSRAQKEDAKMREARQKKKAACDKKRQQLRKRLTQRKRGSTAMVRRMKTMKRKSIGKRLKQGPHNKRLKR